MTLTLLPLTICRTPSFSYEQDLASVWDELKEAIRESSSHFYKEIAHIDASQLNQLPAKIQFTIWKYYNRSIYRATPFGSFASFTVVPLKNEGLYGAIQLDDQAIRHTFTDWSEKEQVFNQQLTSLQGARYLISNSSAYPCGDEIRYISKDGESYSLTSVEASPIILDSLRYCQEKRSIDSIYRWFQQNQGLNYSEAKELITQLVELQLLFTDLQPNITGNEYFGRIGNFSESHTPPYILTESSFIGNAVDHPHLSQLAEAIQFLSVHLPLPVQTALEDFKKKFLKKFEYYEVPLLVALDPELGAGYGGLETNTAESHVFGFDPGKKGNSPPIFPLLNYSGLHQFFLQQLIAHKNPIHLEEYTGKTHHQSPYNVPNTFSAIVRFFGDQLVMEEAGGSTATSLLGRFTLANPVIEQFGKDLASLEATANPEVLFFDIAYTGENHADNINRRKNCYPYELNIHSWCDEAITLSLNDLMVSVQHGEVILRSIKYGKRVVPRLASAYNYTRADLSVFRFLCDLQHQGLKTSLGFDPAHFLPGLDHYPRIQYKNIILSPAKWRLPAALNLVQLSEWLEEKEICQFKYGHADQTLCFHRDKTEDLEMFLAYSKNQPGGYLTETCLADKPIVYNACGQPKLAEIILHFHHAQTIYQPSSGMLAQYNQLQQKSEAWCMPGGSWLYLEIYGHPHRSNELLTQQIAPFIQSYRHLLKNWFFIRYNLNGPHLRLRMQLKQLQDGYCLMKSFSQHMVTALREGIIADLQIKPYKRETERYHAVPIDLTEALFSLDSIHILQLIQQFPTTHQLYNEALTLMELVLDGCGITIQQQIAHVSTLIGYLNHDVKTGLHLFKEINKSYQAFKLQQKAEPISKTVMHATRKLSGSYISLVQPCPSISQLSFLTDLFHMHINRLFTSEQQTHEQMIYHFLQTRLKEKANYHRPTEVTKVSFHENDLCYPVHM